MQHGGGYETAEIDGLITGPLRSSELAEIMDNIKSPSAKAYVAEKLARVVPTLSQSNQALKRRAYYSRKATVVSRSPKISRPTQLGNMVCSGRFRNVPAALSVYRQAKIGQKDEQLEAELFDSKDDKGNGEWSKLSARLADRAVCPLVADYIIRHERSW
jgi:hypothetical protein